jgi:putative oxidoreductase
MDARRQDLTNSVGLLILRLGAGGYMLTHGWGKLQMVFAGKFADFPDPIGLGGPLSLVLATFAEFVCAILVMIGFGTRFAAAPIVFTMAVAALVAHGSDPWTSGEAARLFSAGETKFPVSKEPAVLFLTVFLTLIFTGAGRLSIDGLIWPWWRARRARRRAGPVA